MKYVLITGAGQGIGAQTAQDLKQQGFSLILLGRTKEKLEQTAKNLSCENTVIVPCDLSKPDEFGKIENALNELKGPLQGLVNNAGIFIRKSIETTSLEDWESLFTVNLLGPSLLTNLILPHLKKSTADHKFIINISSTAAERPVENAGVYGSLKLALTHLTKVLALELADQKICANVISPGVIDTPIHSIASLDPDHQKMYQQLQPLGKVGQPTDISAMVCFLASEKAKWITGSNFIVDGGLSLK